MLVLDTINKTITAVMSAVPATSQPNYVVAYADNNGTTFVEGATDGTLNGTSTVTIIPAPAASTRRIIKSIYIQNTDTAQVTVTVGYYNGTNTRVLAKVTLNVNDTWTTDATFDPNGQLKYVFGSVNASTQLTGVAPPVNGGTGVANNNASTITISGAYPLTQTLTGSTSVTLPTTGTLSTLAGTETLTNKRINPRVSTTTSSSSAVTPDISSYDQYNWTAQAATLTINAPTGTPVDGNKLIFRILDNGTSQTLSFNATFTAIGVTIPSTTTASKTTYVGCVYNANNTRWDVIAVTTQA
jgi:hypothetical protein